MSAAEGASEASSPEQANEWAVRANEQMDERVAQYLRLNSCLFQTTEQRLNQTTENDKNRDRGPPWLCNSQDWKMEEEEFQKDILIREFAHKEKNTSVVKPVLMFATGFVGE